MVMIEIRIHGRGGQVHSRTITAQVHAPGAR
jgi:hypothetical protein